MDSGVPDVRSEERRPAWWRREKRVEDEGALTSVSEADVSADDRGIVLALDGGVLDDLVAVGGDLRARSSDELVVTDADI